MRRLTFGVVLILVSLLVAGCGDNSKETSDAAKMARLDEQNKNLRKEVAAANKELRRKQREIASLEKRLGVEPSNAGSAAADSGRPVATGGATTCSDALSVGPNTTCSFAENVRSAYFDAGGGDVTVSVYSPVKGAYYTMTCREGAPSVCTGGNNAAVYIR